MDRTVRRLDLLGRRPRLLDQGDPLLVRLQTVEGRTMKGHEALEPLESVLILEHLGVGRDSRRLTEDAGTTTVIQLLAHDVRRRVGTREEPRVTGRRHLAQRETILLPLEDRKAVGVRAQPPVEQGVAVPPQVMRRDGREQVTLTALHELDCSLSRDVLEHDAQIRQLGQEPLQDPVDEHVLAAEDVDRPIGDLTVKKERHPDLAHAPEDWQEPEDVGDALSAVRSGVRRIQLGRHPGTRPEAPLELVGIGLVGQVAGAESTRETGGRDPFQVGESLLQGRDRVLAQVGHGDLPAEDTRARGHRREHRAITQMQVPVVWPSQNHDSPPAR